MKRLIRKIKFISIATFMIFALVASSKLHHQPTNIQGSMLNACITSNSIPCTIYPSPLLPTPTPDVPQNEQERFLAAIARKLTAVPQTGSYEYILLRAYGAPFLTTDSTVQLPPKVFFNNEQETQAFQSTLPLDKVNGTRDCYLQKAAANALNQARSITNIPLKSGYGASDCTRNYATNLRFWRKYANQNTLEKVREGKETAILGVVAPPGASQHLWGLAIDLRVSNPQQRQALNQNGWFQTVENDVPHWTYLGVRSEDLTNLGLKNKIVRGVNYWLTPI